MSAVSGKAPGVPGSVPGAVWGLMAPLRVCGAASLRELLSLPSGLGPKSPGLGQLLFWPNHSPKGKASN